MKNDVGAFMRAVTPRIDSAINQVANTCAAMAYGDGHGYRGVIGNIYLTEANEADFRSIKGEVRLGPVIQPVLRPVPKRLMLPDQPPTSGQSHGEGHLGH